MNVLRMYYRRSKLFFYHFQIIETFSERDIDTNINIDTDTYTDLYAVLHSTLHHTL